METSGGMKIIQVTHHTPSGCDSQCIQLLNTHNLSLRGPSGQGDTHCVCQADG